MAIRKTKKGSDLKRWFAEKWTDQKGRPCGNSKTKGVKKCRPSKKISGETPGNMEGGRLPKILCGCREKTGRNG
jgi:hypothetical protein